MGLLPLHHVSQGAPLKESSFLVVTEASGELVS